MFKKMRRFDKQMSEKATLELLKKSEIGTLSTIGENGYPYNTPLNYVFYQGKIYFHCAKVGSKLDNIRNNSKICFSVFDEVKVIGEELNTRYKSLVIFGKAKIIEPSQEILRELILKYVQMDEDVIKQRIAKEIDITQIVEIEIEHITGKIGK
jgi:nitroimidazol reductase NimA-like FMN-containing flavoprotein (pyridoxamine 5'-phosphate oxidase superfamily)